MLPLRQPPDWMRQAACLQSDPELFFPGRGASLETVRSICATCPVRLECLALGWDERTGVWGGTSVRERRKLHREHGTVEAAVAAIQAQEQEDRRMRNAERAREAALRAKRDWKPEWLRQEVV